MNLNATKYDPNVADFMNVMQTASKIGAVVNVNYTHLKPTKVIKDTKKVYIAKYRDNHGSYMFKIQKDAKGTYTVISDGHVVYSGATKKRVVYEFENQINSNPIKCL